MKYYVRVRNHGRPGEAVEARDAQDAATRYAEILFADSSYYWSPQLREGVVLLAVKMYPGTPEDGFVTSIEVQMEMKPRFFVVERTTEAAS